MSETATDSVGSLGEREDEVVPNETLVITPVPSLQGAKVEETRDSNAAKDSGPPDGGYGWIVVMYFPCVRGVDVVLFVC